MPEESLSDFDLSVRVAVYFDRVQVIASNRTMTNAEAFDALAHEMDTWTREVDFQELMEYVLRRQREDIQIRGAWARDRVEQSIKGVFWEEFDRERFDEE